MIGANEMFPFAALASIKFDELLPDKEKGTCVTKGHTTEIAREIWVYLSLQGRGPRLSPSEYRFTLRRNSLKL